MGDVLLFRDRFAPLEGVEREAAVARFREILPAIVAATVNEGFSKACRAALDLRCELSAEEGTRMFIEAFRAQIERLGAC